MLRRVCGCFGNGGKSQEKSIHETDTTLLPKHSTSNGEGGDGHVANQTRAAWLAADSNQDGKLSVKEVIKLCQELNIRAPPKVIASWFEQHDEDHNGQLDFNEFTKFFNAIHSAPDLSKEFLVACEPEKPWKAEVENTFMTCEKLKKFTNQFLPKDRQITIDQAKEIVHRYSKMVHELGMSAENADDKQHTNSPSTSMDTLSYAGFLLLMTDPTFNLAIDPHVIQNVTDDMTQPLSHYFISSSHNTYLSGNQIASASSTEPIKRALLLGVRVIELDAWDGPKGPQVTHGHTLCRPIGFRECVATIYKYGFQTSEFPVIVTVENHCSFENQKVEAQILREELKERLYLWEEDEDAIRDGLVTSHGPTAWKSPMALRGKVLVRDKPVNKKRRKKQSGSQQQQVAQLLTEVYQSNNEGNKEETVIQEFPASQLNSGPIRTMSTEVIPPDLDQQLDDVEAVLQFDFGQNIADLEDDYDTGFDQDTVVDSPRREELIHEQSVYGTVLRIVDDVDNDDVTITLGSDEELSPTNQQSDNVDDLRILATDNDDYDDDDDILDDEEDEEVVVGDHQTSNEELGITSNGSTGNDSIRSGSVGQAKPITGIHPDWLQLLYVRNKHIPVRFNDGQPHFHESTQVTSSSIGETKMNKLVAPGAASAAMNSYAKRHLVRVYPAGNRVNSSNYDPVPAWNSGCQLVALNYQTADEGVWLSQGKFLLNGRCGYVLKPAAMLRATRIGVTTKTNPASNDENMAQEEGSAHTRRKSKVDRLLGGESQNLASLLASQQADDTGGPSLPWDLDYRAVPFKTLRITVISCHYIPKIKSSSIELQSSDINPFVMLSVRGVPSDTAAKQTSKVKGNRFNPTWNQSFEFKISCKELALLVFKLYSANNAKPVSTSGPLLIGQVVYPLVALREGYRVVPLYKANLAPLDFTYVFCKFEWV